MNNFQYFNPTRIVFGKGAIAELPKLLPAGARVLVTYGGGSIKKNGVYDQVKAALAGHTWFEFGGIEPNPVYETLMRAVELARREQVDFLLAVGGGSVLDGTKLIAAAIPYTGENAWDIVVQGGAPVKQATPLAAVLTLPATGSEANSGGVITRKASQEKLGFGNELLFPVFSILDPETTFSLPPKQVRNGVVDAFVHCAEQYLTYPVNGVLQDRQAEAVMLTLVEEGSESYAKLEDYDARANLMWAATQALNSLISRGVPGDWATHGIGHEITAFYGLDHAETLAIVMPSLLRHQLDHKLEKLAQFGQRVWGLPAGDPRATALEAIARTEEFFHSIDMPTRLADYGIDPQEAAQRVQARFEQRGTHLGEHRNITAIEAAEILRAS